MSRSTNQSKKHGIRVEADYARASSLIRWQPIDSDPHDAEAWRATPFQVADARHDSQRAIKLVSDWLDSEG